MHKLKQYLIFVLVIIIPSIVVAGEALDKLNKYTGSLKSLQAKFTQTLFDQNMRQIEVANGTVYIEKPGKFRWDYQRPYEQVIVADGNKLWMFDVELDQVTVKPMADALGSTPAALLTSNEPLEKQFKIIELGEIDKRLVVQLEAKIKDTDYAYILLAMGKKDIEIMELKDKLGQVTRIELEKPKVNQKIDKKVFMFTPPKGVDVIGDY